MWLAMKHSLNALTVAYQPQEIFAHTGHASMSKITNSAKNETCSIRVIGYCNGDTATTVFAHINGIRYGHGVGQKVDDLLGAYACSSCHDAVDGRIRTNHSKNDLKLWHLEGMAETLLKLKAKGIL
jgi:hypothetical protein